MTHSHSRSPEAVLAVRSAVESDLRAFLMADGGAPGSLILVACSGGADSVALAAALAYVAPRLGLRAGAVSVDHGLQAGSREISERAAALCADLGLEPALAVGGRTESRADTSAGPEGAARNLRYAALECEAERLGAAAVLLGHTLDDQAETVLLGLARGSGTRALAGMPPARGIFRRPLLGLRRADTRAACVGLGLPVWDDPTNAADGPLRTAAGNALPRVALRHHVLPELERALGPGTAAALARTAELARDDAEYLETAAHELYARAAVEPDRDGEIHLEVTVLEQAHPALRRRVLHLAALAIGAPAGDVAHVHVQAVDALLIDWHGQGPIHLPGPTEALRRCGRLVLRTGASARAPRMVRTPKPNEHVD